MAETNFVDVKIQVGKTTQNVQMEKGCLFQNKGGSYCIFDDGTLKFQKAGTNEWQNASHINMTNYQWKAFQNVADNDGKSRTFSQKDILNAQQKFKQGEFKADISKDLPNGYKIEHPKMSSADKSVEVDVTNGNKTQSAKLKFQVAEMQAIKDASASKGSKTMYKNYYGSTVTVVKDGNTVTKRCDQKRRQGDTDGEGTCHQFAKYENGKLKHVYYYQFLGDGYSMDEEYKFDSKGRVTYHRMGKGYPVEIKYEYGDNSYKEFYRENNGEWEQRGQYAGSKPYSDEEMTHIMEEINYVFESSPSIYD